jgi:hypothetical protein
MRLQIFFMYKFALSSFLLLTSLLCKSQGICESKGIYFSYSIGIPLHKETLVNLEIGYPSSSSNFFFTGLASYYNYGSERSHLGLGFQGNYRLVTGNDEIISYANFLGYYSPEIGKISEGFSVGSKWLKRLQPTSNYFATAGLSYRTIDNANYRSIPFAHKFIPEIGVIFFLPR